jgi:hypothetical protein
MVVVSAGTFLMGSPERETGHGYPIDQERPIASLPHDTLLMGGNYHVEAGELRREIHLR